MFFFFLSFTSKRTCKGYHRSVKNAIKDLGRSLMLHYHHKPASALTKVTWKASQKGSGHYRNYMFPGLYQQIMPITQRSPKICFTDTWDCLELCRRVRDTKDTTDIPETPKIGGKHSIYVRDTTVVFRTTHVCRGNTDMSRISQACQDYHMSFRETLHTC